jgi:hypothetical protein
MFKVLCGAGWEGEIEGEGGDEDDDESICGTETKTSIIGGSSLVASMFTTDPSTTDVN